MKHEKNSYLILFFISVFGYILQLGLNTFLARHLTEAFYGDFNLAIKILNIFVLFMLLGSGMGAYRFLAKFLQLKKKTLATSYVSWNIKLLCTTFLIGLIISVLAFIIMFILHIYHLKHINSYHLIVYTLWIFPFVASSILLYVYFGSTKQVILGNIYTNVIVYITQLILFSVIVLLFESVLDNISLISVVLLSYLFIISLFFRTMNQTLSSLLFNSIKHSIKTPLADHNKEWLYTNTRLSFNSLLFNLIGANGLIFLELLSSNEALVGYYSAGLVITNVISIIFDGFYLKLYPNISALLSNKNNFSYLSSQLNKTNLVSFIYLIIISVIIFLFEKPILLLFGPGYTQAERVVSILVIAIGIDCYAGVGSRLLLYGGFESVSLKIKIVEYFISLVFIIPMTFYLSMLGTAIATLMTAFIKLLMNIYLCQTKLKIRLFYA